MSHVDYSEKRLPRAPAGASVKSDGRLNPDSG
jgi:hypothetical protein